MIRAQNTILEHSQKLILMNARIMKPTAFLFRFYYVIACGGMERMTGSRK